MKKIITFVFMFVLSIAPCVADTIYHNDVAVLEGKIEGVMDGLINIKSTGSLYSVVRPAPSPVFKDVVVAKKRVISRKTIRYSGKVVFADNYGVEILCGDTRVIIPRNRVKTIDLYIP